MLFGGTGWDIVLLTFSQGVAGLKSAWPTILNPSLLFSGWPHQKEYFCQHFANILPGT